MCVNFAHQQLSRITEYVKNFFEKQIDVISNVLLEHEHLVFLNRKQSNSCFYTGIT